MLSLCKSHVRCAVLLAFIGAAPVFAQQVDSADSAATEKVLNLVPDAATVSPSDEYTPLTAAEKFKVAGRDAFDPDTAAIAAAVAGASLERDANPSFGEGVAGYAHDLGTASADLAVGYYMTEAVFPTFLHQDPRYFRHEGGGAWSRMGHAIGQVFLTRGDNGSSQFNYSRLAGDATTVLVSMAYYPDHRNAGDASEKFGIRIGADIVTNLVKEFAPDIARKFSRKH